MSVCLSRAQKPSIYTRRCFLRVELNIFKKIWQDIYEKVGMKNCDYTTDNS